MFMFINENRSIQNTLLLITGEKRNIFFLLQLTLLPHTSNVWQFLSLLLVSSYHNPPPFPFFYLLYVPFLFSIMFLQKENQWRTFFFPLCCESVNTYYKSGLLSSVYCILFLCLFFYKKIRGFFFLFYFCSNDVARWQSGSGCLRLFVLIISHRSRLLMSLNDSSLSYWLIWSSLVRLMQSLVKEANWGSAGHVEMSWYIISSKTVKQKCPKLSLFIFPRKGDSECWWSSLLVLGRRVFASGLFGVNEVLHCLVF